MMQSANKEIRRVAVIRLDEIGDVILTSAFLRELRGLLPNARITLIVKPAVYNIVELCPYVDEILTYDWSSRRYWGRMQGLWRAFRFARRKLRSQEIDLAIIPRWDADYYHATYIAYFSNATRRIGYSEKVAEDKKRWNRGYDRLFTDLLPDEGPRHEVQRGLDVARFLGGNVRNETIEVWLSPKDESFAQHLMESEEIKKGDTLIAFGVGKRHPKRMWPIENFIALGNWLIGRYGARIVVMGDGNDIEFGHQLREQLGSGVVDLTGRTTLRETAATLKRCQLYVGNDSGLMHMAAAINIPVLVTSCHPASGSTTHPNSPLRFGPWKVPSAVLQPANPIAPCSAFCAATEAHCIRQVLLDDVKTSVIALLAGVDRCPNQHD